MASSTKYPSSVASYDDGNPVAWSTPGNAVSQNGSSATAVLTEVLSTSHVLRSTGYGFAIPEDATIVGVKLEVYVALPAQVAEGPIRLTLGGAAVGDDKSSYMRWNHVQWNTYGGATDLWGLLLTPADVNASSFGADVSAQYDAVEFEETANIDAVRITVYYTTPGASSGFRNLCLTGAG